MTAYADALSPREALDLFPRFSAERMKARFLFRVLDPVKRGRLDLTLPNGVTVRFGGHMQGVHAAVKLCHFNGIRRVIRAGHVGFAEGWMAGEWESPDLEAFLRFFVENDAEIEAHMPGKSLVRAFNRVRHLLRANTKSGSKRNIEYHYDLGNDFYQLWLDGSMTYSSALFDGANDDLGAAQEAKYRRILDQLQVKPGARILEIGCGWGGLAEIAARDYGAIIHGVTLSREQLAWYQKRMADAGLSDKATASLTDYRDARGTYDHIVSIEMFEAVGMENWGTYFDVVRDRLKPGGTAMLQVITIDERRFDSYASGADFIQKYIFPGGMLPSPERLVAAAGAKGFAARDQYMFGLDYARTLKHWADLFNASWDEQDKTRYDARFKRMWDYYLAYCEAGFRTKATDVGQFMFVRGE